MELITTQKALEDFCAALSAKPFIAVDTEFMREKTYWPILCLIQAAGPNEGEDSVEGMIDPLAEGLDLAPFLKLLGDETIIKVLHAARQDVEIFYKLMGTVPAPLFDTQVAAMALGYGDQVGYEPLMRDLLNAKIDKGSRFTDWARRPLTEAQLTYALSDVTHLRDAYPMIRDQLTDKNRSHWVTEEMDGLKDPGIYFVKPETAWTRLKLRNVRPKELGPLVKLAEWREREAQSRDVPRSRILKDDGLFELARMRPANREDLSRARSIPKGYERSEAAGSMLGAIADGRNMPMETLPDLDRGERQVPPPADVLELLRVLLKIQCEQHSVAPKMIANASDLETIARLKPAESLPENNLPDIAAFRGWRMEVFGTQALKLKRGELALALRGKAVDLIDLSSS